MTKTTVDVQFLPIRTYDPDVLERISHQMLSQCGNSRELIIAGF